MVLAVAGLGGAAAREDELKRVDRGAPRKDSPSTLCAVIVVMAIFGFVTGFSTVRVAQLPDQYRADFRLKGLAAAALSADRGIGLALVWPLMKEGVRQWTLSYVLAYAAGMLVASYGRVEMNGASVTGPSRSACLQIRPFPSS